MRPYTRRAWILFAPLFAFVAAACGGGGGESDPPGATRPPASGATSGAGGGDSPLPGRSGGSGNRAVITLAGERFEFDSLYCWSPFGELARARGAPLTIEAGPAHGHGIYAHQFGDDVVARFSFSEDGWEEAEVSPPVIHLRIGSYFWAAETPSPSDSYGGYYPDGESQVDEYSISGSWDRGWKISGRATFIDTLAHTGQLTVTRPGEFELECNEEISEGDTATPELPESYVPEDQTISIAIDGETHTLDVAPDPDAGTYGWCIIVNDQVEFSTYIDGEGGLSLIRDFFSGVDTFFIEYLRMDDFTYERFTSATDPLPAPFRVSGRTATWEGELSVERFKDTQRVTDHYPVTVTVDCGERNSYP